MNSPLSISLKCREQDFELDVAFEIGPGITTVFGARGCTGGAGALPPSFQASTLPSFS